jgi:hypothetical protein
LHTLVVVSWLLQVFVDYTPAQIRLQLSKAAAAEAAAAGAGAAAQRAAAAAAGRTNLASLLPGGSSCSNEAAAGSSSQPPRQRRQQPGGSSSGNAAKGQNALAAAAAAAVTYNQADLNALGLRALGRRIAAAFPSVGVVVLHLEVGDYADHAAPGETDHTDGFVSGEGGGVQGQSADYCVGIIHGVGGGNSCQGCQGT